MILILLYTISDYKLQHQKMMIKNKVLSVMLSLEPKYLHPEFLNKNIYEQLKKIEGQSFLNIGKITKIKKINSVDNGKIHNDTGFSKSIVTFVCDIYLPEQDEIIEGKVESFEQNGGVYVNYKNYIKVFCLNMNITSILQKKDNNYTQKFEIGEIVKVKLTKVNFNDNNLIVIGKIL